MRWISHDAASSRSQLEDLAASLDRTRRQPRGVAHGRNLDAVERVLGLDDAILRWQRSVATRATPRPERVIRSVVPLGLGALFLNRVDVVRPDGTARSFLEKGVWSTSSEARFWTAERVAALRLHGKDYRTVEPAAVLAAEPLTVLYLPFMDELGLSRRDAQRNFRSNLDPIVTAVANLNATNLLDDTGGWLRQRRFRPVAPPTVRALVRHLRVDEDEARQLRARWERVATARAVLERDLERLPVAFAHNDIGPGNAVHLDGTTWLLDFGMAGLAPLGSDLHSVIRWSGVGLTDRGEQERLIGRYTEVVRDSGVDIGTADVRLAAWWSYHLRYSNLAWRSARRLEAFSLALRAVEDLVAERAPA